MLQSTTETPLPIWKAICVLLKAAARDLGVTVDLEARGAEFGRAMR